MNFKESYLSLLLLTVVAVVLCPWQATDAQLLMVTGQYRVVELDKQNQRVGVALPEAQPDTRQNWIYVQANTEVVKRHSNGDGWFKDEKLSYDGFFDSTKPGDMMKVHGGRRWDGGITAKKIWM